MAEGTRGSTGKRRGRGRRAVTETSSGGVVFRRDEGGVRFLLIRDPYDNWGLPKGHLEQGETPEEAACREVAEETELTGLRVVAQLPTIDWFFRQEGRLIHKFCYFFLLESPGGDARPQAAEGISECVWLSAKEALRTITYDNARAVLEAGARELGALGSDAGAVEPRPGPAPRQLSRGERERG